MNTEFGSLTTIANPFAAFLSPDIVMAADERPASRVTGTVYRPLDKPMLPKVGYETIDANSMPLRRKSAPQPRCSSRAKSCGASRPRPSRAWRQATTRHHQTREPRQRIHRRDFRSS
jgi:hypothetical protein